MKTGISGMYGAAGTSRKVFSFYPSSFIVIAVLLLSGCGFQLRGAAHLPYETLHVAASTTSTFATQLRRAVTSGSQTKVVDNPKEAQATLHVLSEQRQKAILSLSGGGRVREFQLIYLVSYRVADKDNKELRAPTQIRLHRDFSFNDSDTLSKESEEALLYRDMQTDAVNQLMRQLQATRATAASL
jgi:LPS-assembly lipoprotein